ncbi:MAG: ribosome maturation factor RimP [Syntrophothermus sp.]
MNTLNEKIRSIALNTAEKNGFFLIDLIVRGSEQNRVFEIYIDGEKNVSAEDCALVSREINTELSEMLPNAKYRLDVSSPGVERPLIYLKQYHKHINRKFEVDYKLGEQVIKMKGKLLNVDGENLTFETDKKQEVIVNFNNITKAIVIISFS